MRIPRAASWVPLGELQGRLLEGVGKTQVAVQCMHLSRFFATFVHPCAAMLGGDNARGFPAG
jgi:hypothetical protein